MSQLTMILNSSKKKKKTMILKKKMKTLPVCFMIVWITFGNISSLYFRHCGTIYILYSLQQCLRASLSTLWKLNYINIYTQQVLTCLSRSDFYCCRVVRLSVVISTVVVICELVVRLSVVISTVVVICELVCPGVTCLSKSCSDL